MTRSDIKHEQGLFKDKRHATVAGWLKNMTTEAIRIMLSNLETCDKFGEDDFEGWKVSDIGQLKDEYDNRLYKNRV